MGLFYRRYLCFFCFIFMLSSILVWQMELELKLWIIFAVTLLCAVCALLCVAVKKRRILFLSVVLSLCAVLAATLSSAVRISYRELKAEEYVGEREVRMHIVSESYESDHTSAYTAKLSEINGDSVSFKALLVCAFPTDLDVGDTVIASAELMDTGARVLGMTSEQRSDDADILLTAVLYQADGALVDRFDRDMPMYRYVFEENGITVAVSDIKEAVTHRLETVLGEDVGAVARGFLLGDRSDIPTNIIRDFRRSGVSHLFAVSGLHISILLGVVELVLRRLYVHKLIRIGTVSFLALVLLALTGFSMSALRAVFMLWLVYITFICSEEADPPTTLFCAITLIIIIFPYSVCELGMWMSFLATLGLVTVYPVFESMIPKTKKGGRLRKIPIELVRQALLVMLMTVVCNTFLLPIQWKIFGELSLVSIAANILLSPLTAVFMVASVVALALGGIPVIGEAVVWVVEGVCGLICNTVGYLSSLDIATVSLRYFFADVLIIALTAALTVMLVIKLKRKWLIAVPVLSFAMAFSVCVAVFNIRGEQKVTYYGDGTREMLSVCSVDTVCIVDMSNGAYFRFADALSDASQNGATSIEKIVFTDITQNHLSSMEYLFRSAIVKNVYIPTPTDQKSLDMAISMAVLAEKCGVETHLYESTDIIEAGEAQMCVNTATYGKKIAVAVFVSGENKMLGYVDAFICQSEDAQTVNGLLAECDTVIIGNNGVPDVKYTYSLAPESTVIYSSEKMKNMSGIRGKEIRAYCNVQESVTLVFDLK